MNLHRVFMILAIGAACVAECSAAHESSQPLAIPVDVPAQQGRPVECVVHLNPPLPICALAFSPDEKTLAVGGYGEVLLWDVQNGSLMKRVGAGRLSGTIRAVSFLSDGKTLAVGNGLPSVPGEVNLLDIASGKSVAAFKDPKGMVTCLAIGPDGNLLAAGDDAAGVSIWNLNERKLVKKLETHTASVCGAAFSPDNKQLVTAADKNLVVVNVESWDESRRYAMPGAIHSVAFSRDGKRVLAAVGDVDGSTIRVADAGDDSKDATPRKASTRVFATTTGTPLAIVWPAKSDNFFVAFNDHALRAYDGAGGRTLKTYQAHRDWVYGVASNTAGTKLASGGADGVVRLWNAAEAKPVAAFVQFSPGDDAWAVVTSQGYLNTSASRQIGWKGVPVGATKDLTVQYNKPELVRKALMADTSAPSAPKNKAAGKNAKLESGKRGKSKDGSKK